MSSFIQNDPSKSYYFLHSKAKIDRYCVYTNICYNVTRRTEPPRRDYPGRLVEGSFHFYNQIAKISKKHKSVSFRSFKASLVSSFMKHVPTFYTNR